MNSQNRTVLITGASLSINYGAQAMALSLIHKLRVHDPKTIIVFSTPYFVHDRKLAKQLDIELIDRGSLGQYIENSLRIVCVKWFGMAFLSNSYVQAYLYSDAILDISGDMLTDSYGYKVFFRKFKEFIIMNMLKKKILILPQSIGPFNRPFTAMVAKYFFKKTKWIMPREKITETVLNSLGLGNISPIFPDLALSLLPSGDSEDVLFYSRLIHSSGKIIIGLSISGSITKYTTRKKGNKIRNDQSRFIEKFVTALQTIKKKYNVVFVFIPHVIGPKHEDDDRIISKMVAEKVDEAACILVEGIEDSRKLKYLISCCDFFIGSRMHANIAALSSAVPTMSIAYSHKFRGIMDMFGLGKYVVDYTVLTDKILENTMIEFIENKNELKSMMKHKYDLVTKGISHFDDVLDREIAQI